MMNDADALAVFDGKSLSYTYDSGMSVTNVFDGTARSTEFGGETLVEEVTVKNVAADVYYVVWTDAERGPASQVVNLAENKVNTAIAMDGVLMVMSGTVTGLE